MNKNPLVVIFLTVFLDLVGFGIIIPMSPYLARNFGATAFEVGLLMAIYSGMQFIFSPVWGRISDRIGRRPVLLVSILGTGVAHFLFFLSPSLIYLFLARALAGFFSANISTAMAYIADVTSAKDRSKNMGLIGAAFGLGFIFGPALGGVLTHFGASFPALIASALCVFNFCFAFFVLKESLALENRIERARKSRFKNIFEKMSRPVIGSLMIGQFLVGLAMANMEATLFLFVQDRFSWSMKTASYGFAYVGVCIAITQGYLVRKFLPKLGERVVLILGFILFTFGMSLIGVGHWIYLLAFAMTTLAIGSGLINPALTGALSLLTPATEQGEVIGVNQSLAALARVLGPPLGGYLYMHEMGAPYWAGTTLAATGFVIIWLARKLIPETGKI